MAAPKPPEIGYKEKKWNQMLDKIEFTQDLKETSHFSPSNPLKPGANIFQAIASSNLPIENLKMNIPETLINFGELAWISYDYPTGKLKINKDDFLLRHYSD